MVCRCTTSMSTFDGLNECMVREEGGRDKKRVSDGDNNVVVQHVMMVWDLMMRSHLSVTHHADGGGIHF